MGFLNKYSKYLLLLVIPLSIFLFDYFLKEDRATRKEVDTDAQELNQQTPNFQETPQNRVNETEQKAPEPPRTYVAKQIAWIPSWDMKEGVESFRKNPKIFSAISPVWYSLNKDGSLTKNLSHKAQLLQIAKENNVEVVPSIASFDFSIIKAVLQSPSSYERYLEEIRGIASEEGIDGIDLDYESIEREDKEAFFKMLDDIKKILGSNKTLSVTVLPKWGDDVRYSSLQQTRDVQDWERIGKIADEVRIMTYDYTSQRSATPGPIAPLEWMERVAEYAVTKIDKTKVYLGVHLYGYEWIDKRYNPDIDIENVQLESKVQSNSYSFRTIKTILQDPSVDSLYDARLGEGIASYDCLEKSRCTLFFPTKQSVQERIEIAKKYSLAGVAYWKLGRDEDILNP